MLIAYEPSWPVGDQDIHPHHFLPSTSGFSRLPGRTPLYAFHYYSAPCDPNLSAYLDGRLADAARLRAVPIATEFSMWARDAAGQERMTERLEAFESRLISYTGWQYKSYSGSLPNGTCTGCSNGFFNDDGSLDTYMSRALARPFAQVVAGRVQSRRLNQTSGVFVLTYFRTGGHSDVVSIVGTVPSLTRVVLPGEWCTGDIGVEVAVAPDHPKPQTHFETMPGRQIAQNVKQSPFRILTIDHGRQNTSNNELVIVKIWPKMQRVVRLQR